jgi:hypothetical protein
MKPLPCPPSIVLALNGRRRVLQMQLPATGEVVPHILEPDIRSASIVEMALMLELQSVVESIDGEFLDEATARSIIRDPELLARVLKPRNELYFAAAECGDVLALCPHCRARELEIDLLFYWKTLGLPVWDFFEQAVLLRVPRLASPTPPGRRPAEIATAARLRVRYPGEAGIDRTLTSVSTTDGRRREEQAWAQWVDSVSEKPDERSHWRRTNPGFRAILRLAAALAITPEAVEEMPLGAFLFLDLLHFAAGNVDVPAGTRAILTCPNCGGALLPVF